ncbi:hypothetical protein GOBAR_DD36332 [Gossypium barbadense]|nr:hypothetical protein GOBAR_DD36332 [Gossypium barbadense]
MASSPKGSPPSSRVSSPPPSAGDKSTAPPPVPASSPPNPPSAPPSPPAESNSPSPPSYSSVPVSVGLLLGLILMCLNAMRTKRKEDLEKHVQKGDAEKGIGNKANEHAVNILVSPSGIVGKGGSPREEAPSYFSPKYQSPLGINKCSFTYEELAIATQGFSQKNLLGQGSGQGQREFQAEVEIISRIHHRHLVSFVGFSIAGDKKMLVYEFLPNKTLQFHLHEKGLPTMDWPTRLKIALGAAKGLSYLHEDCHPRIIHRDIKSANILLDFCFEAMVADFGLAKLTQDSNTHVSTRVMGTFGYLAPEYVSSGKLTNKSDVFSFGVVLLELITGRRPYNPTSNMDESLVDWARPLCARAMEDGNFGQLVDPRLGNNFVDHEMASMVSCASACIVCALEDGVPLDDLSETPKLDQSSTSNSKSDDTSNESSSYTLESKEYGSNNNDDTNHCHLNPSSFSSDSSETTSKARDDLK